MKREEVEAIVLRRMQKNRVRNSSDEQHDN